MEERRENCIIHEKEIGMIKISVDEIKKAVFGNGKPGLTYDMVEMKGVVKGMGGKLNLVLSLNLLILAAIVGYIFTK